MKVNVQFVVNCTECFRNGIYNAQPLFADDFDGTWAGAVEYFEDGGWTLLPSGKWFCSEHRSAVPGPRSSIERRAA